MPSSPPPNRAARVLREIVDSTRPIAYVRTPEEQRVMLLVREAAATWFPSPIGVWRWSSTEGLRRDGEPAEPAPASAREALDRIANEPAPAFFVLADFHDPLQSDPTVRRRLRDLYERCWERGQFVILTSPLKVLPEELERTLLYAELPLPDVAELTAFLQLEAGAAARRGQTVDTADDTLFQLARALQGLTIDECRHAVRRAFAASGRLDTASLPALHEEKRALVSRTGMVEYVPSDATIDELGGMELLKEWLDERRRLFQMRESLQRDIAPKGILVMGVSGCGKSLCIKAIAAAFGLPLYRIDMIEVFSGRHGEPELAFAKACHMLESMTPAVVWFDEIEAGIDTQSKEGAVGRLFGFFLTWMQEKPRGLFVGATANRIDLLPAEMIRKGRFDEVFFVDLPLDDERIDIFRVHLRRRGIDPSGMNLEPLKKFTKGWTGAEVEQCVVAALTTAQLQGREPTDRDLLDATANVVPLSKTMKEQVEHIRNWAFDRAVRASPREGRA